jgi:hypothetical protein
MIFWLEHQSTGKNKQVGLLRSFTTKGTAKGKGSLWVRNHLQATSEELIFKTIYRKSTVKSPNNLLKK